MSPTPEIIQKILAGEKNLFDEIVNEYYQQILVYSLKMLNFHQADAEDVTIQVFTKAYLNLASYKPKYKFSSWLYRIAHNEAVNLISKNSRKMVLELPDFLPDLKYQEIDEKIDNQILEKVLNQLRTKDKEILIWFYLQELSLKEISEILKITENSAAQRLRRARIKAKQEAQKIL